MKQEKSIADKRIIENNQKEDGSVVIPKILRKWMANQEGCINNSWNVTDYVH